MLVYSISPSEICPGRQQATDINSLFLVSIVSTSDIRRTKSQHLKDNRTVLRLYLPNPLKPDVESRMKM